MHLQCNINDILSDVELLADCQYDVALKTLSAGGTELSGAGSTVDQCKTKCTADATCAAFDYNKSSGQCFKHDVSSDWETNSFTNGFNIDQYQ